MMALSVVSRSHERQCLLYPFLHWLLARPATAKGSLRLINRWSTASHSSHFTVTLLDSPTVQQTLICSGHWQGTQPPCSIVPLCCLSVPGQDILLNAHLFPILKILSTLWLVKECNYRLLCSRDSQHQCTHCPQSRMNCWFYSQTSTDSNQFPMVGWLFQWDFMSPRSIHD